MGQATNGHLKNNAMEEFALFILVNFAATLEQAGNVQLDHLSAGGIANNRATLPITQSDHRNPAPDTIAV